MSFLREEELEEFFAWMKEQGFQKCSARDPYELCYFKDVEGRKIRHIAFFKNRVEGGYNVTDRLRIYWQRFERREKTPSKNLGFVVKLGANEKRYITVDFTRMKVLSTDNLKERFTDSKHSTVEQEHDITGTDNKTNTRKD